MLPSRRRFESWRALDHPGLTFFSSGRAALGQFLQSNVCKQAEVAVPAYHCDVLSHALLSLGCRVHYYAVTSSLSPDIDSLKRLLTERRVSAALAIHPFGRIIALEDVADLCHRKRTMLVEDAAHLDLPTLLSERQFRQVGAAVISSPRKYYPTSDGGCLLTSGHGHIAHPARSMLEEARAARQLVQSHPSPDSFPIDRDFSSEFNPEARCDPRYDANHPLAMSFVARAIVKSTDSTKILRQRARNYSAIAEVANEINGVSVLHEEAPIHAYAVPLLLDEPEGYYRLRELGVEAWRWENLRGRGCPTTDHYERHLIQVPCHQDVSENDLDFLIQTLRKALG